MRLSHGTGLWMNGNRLRVRYNRVGYRERNGVETRVLRIDGPNDKMNHAYWMEYFTSACVFELDDWVHLGATALGRSQMEFRFAAWTVKLRLVARKSTRTPSFTGSCKFIMGGTHVIEVDLMNM